MPTGRIPRALRKPRTAASQDSPIASEAASLVDFLSAAQQYDVPFLPIASQKGLDILGRGLSGGIQQSTADVVTALAFKEGVPSRHEHDTDQNQDWHSLITEITILQHPPIRESPRFVDLLGISFHVESTIGIERRAWPLLITSKVNRGDLASVLRNEQDGLLTADVRMLIFSNIAEAVYVLHACGAAHGDLKPDNFLVEETEAKEINCLLIDFGSSVLKGQKRLPTTNEPWNAPELGNSSSSLGYGELAQADVYSFGLVCLHVLLPIQILRNENLCLIRTPEQSDDEWANLRRRVKEAKEKEAGDALAARLSRVIRHRDVPSELQDLLQIIVATTIGPQSGRRTIPWADLLPHIEKYLSHSFRSIPRLTVSSPPLVSSSMTFDHSRHKLFNISDALGELDDTDYVLRADIANDLLYKSEDSACSTCRLQYAFNAAVYRTIGFGGCQDIEASQKLLAKSCKTQEDLESAIQEINAAYKLTGRVAKRVLDALGIGILVSSDRSEQYQISRRLPEAEQKIKTEIEARVHVFGETSLSLAKLRSELSLVLKAQNRLSEAERCQQVVVRILDQHFGERHPSSLIARINLATIFAKQGRLLHAEEIQRSVHPILAEVTGPEHPDTIAALHSLALTLVELGEFVEAESLMREVISYRSNYLTSNHPDTIIAEFNLVSILRAQGLLAQALDLMRSIDQKLTRIIGGNDLSKARFHLVRTLLLKDLGLLDQAMETVNMALAAMDRLQLPENDILRLDGLDMLASVYGASHNRDKQETILRKVLHTKRTLSDNDRELGLTKCLLAQNLLYQGRLREAFDMADEVLRASERSVTINPDNFITSVDIQATVLAHWGKIKEAEEMRRDILQSCKTQFGDYHSLTLNAMYSLGEFLSDQGDYDKAKWHFERALSHLRGTPQPGKDAIKVAKLLAINYREQGEFQDAEKYCKEAIVWATNAVGEEHIETLAVYHALATVYTRMRRFAEAEDIYANRLEKQTRGNQLEMYIKQSMSHLRRAQGRSEEAQELQVEAHRLMKEMLEKSNPDLIKMEGNVLCDALRQAETLTDQLEKEVLENIQLKKRVLGATHLSTLTTMSELAYAYGAHGRFEDSEKLFNEMNAMGGIEAVQSPDRYATLLAKQAEVYLRMGQPEKTEELERKALAVRQRIFGVEHNAVLVTMANLASTLHAQKKDVEAEGYLRQILSVRESKPMTDPQSIFSFLKSRVALGAVLYSQGKLQESARLYVGAVQAAQRVGLPATIVDIWKADLEHVLHEMTQQGISALELEEAGVTDSQAYEREDLAETQ
ncbi:TPR-like protein [Lepidopterella palustris CBS 459.81]|uniref:TPR-like protein n=1 Tax=Lepidopterella palustris CBS 459.81 TaxID=1314670 RepID=A0A8E2JAE5_9PEZI|nr:TPR-like protein [Lepidopterella palustris CBS 459.81]